MLQGFCGTLINRLIITKLTALKSAGDPDVVQQVRYLQRTQPGIDCRQLIAHAPRAQGMFNIFGTTKRFPSERHALIVAMFFAGCGVDFS